MSLDLLGQSDSADRGRVAVGQSWVVALSARNEQELRRLAGSIHEWLLRGRNGISLGELSRSLNVGRTHFGVRFCGLFDSLEELSVALERRAAGTAPRRADVEPPRQALETATSALEESGTGPKERRAALEAVCDWYRQGADIDWRRVCGDPSEGAPFDLPTYPFADVEFWFQVGRPHSAISGARPWTVDSFWDADMSRLGRQGFAKLLGDDDSSVLQHRVEGGALVHAAFYFELALAGLKALRCRVDGLRWRSCVWANHLVLGRRVPVCIWLRDDGDTASFEIGLGSETTEEIVMQGKWETDSRGPASPFPDPYPTGAARERATAAAVYETLAARGVEYALDARLIESINLWAADDAWVELSSLAPESDGQEPVRQALFAALQAAEFLIARSSKAPAVVEKIESIAIADAAREPRFARVRSTASGQGTSTYDIVVLDANREVVVVLEQVVFQLVGGARGAGGRLEQVTSGPMLARPRFVARPSDVRAPSTIGGSVLIFDTDDRLARRVRESDAAVAVVLPGAEFRRCDALTYTIDVARGEHYTAVLEALRGESFVPGHIVHRWAKGDFGYRPNQIDSQLDHGVRSLYWMARALVAARWDRPVQLLFWYGGRPELVQPLGASAAGLLRTFALEQARTTVRAVEDAWSEDDPVKAEVMLRAELAGWSGDVEVRYDSGGRSAKTYELVSPLPAPAPHPVRAHGTYVLTGGLGGLGLLFAERFARLAPVNLVLTGRSAPTPRQEDVMARCGALGSRVTFVRCDVTRQDEVDELVARVHAEYGPINGVVHAAGVLRDGLVATKGLDALNEVIAPKIAGTVHLDIATRREPLDFFVMFSSLVGAVGNVGQADFAAANAFQLAFAEMRDAQRVTSERAGVTRAIAWGYWHEGGMRVTEDVDSVLAARGMVSLSNEVGFALFDEALRAEAPALIAAQGDSSKLLPLLTKAGRG
ncbi:SDR family NAD(P)-dependent oxidoreductase [Sorangium sp. So ce1151]|uniref:SDR family NAD(P)-dependent oxidoreductase n=1 Tax=Sorangium sp. So ce1151 TaxID=3133332 RepID=UPI003F62721F